MNSAFFCIEVSDHWRSSKDRTEFPGSMVVPIKLLNVLKRPRPIRIHDDDNCRAADLCVCCICWSSDAILFLFLRPMNWELVRATRHRITSIFLAIIVRLYIRSVNMANTCLRTHTARVIINYIMTKTESISNEPKNIDDAWSARARTRERVPEQRLLLLLLVFIP